MSSKQRLVYLDPARIEGKRWTIYVCAEPDGKNCDSGTHPHILRHECAALQRWHEAMAARKSPDEPCAEPGPTVVMIEVEPVPGQGYVDPDG